MKTNLVRQCSLVVAAGLTFALGCARPSAQPEQPKTVTAPAAPLAGVDAPVAVVTNAEPIGSTDDLAAANDPAVADTNAPAILDRIPPAVQPQAVALSPGLAEVVKLAQAGVGEEVIVAYIEKFEGRFDLDADQIVYLNDLGLSSSVITALLKKDGKSEEAVAALTNAPSIVQTQVVSNVPQGQALPVYPGSQPEEQAAPEVTTQVAPPPSSPEVSYFYDTLAPYGSWLYVSGYGWCWQPTVAVSVPTWRPYFDRGRWYWSDAGWYWASDYSWGWAPFHYGRWYHHARSGWIWAPGTVWGPAWVSWRYYDGYCGWAPLPPEARFVTGVGLTFHSRRVTAGFDFGLSPFHYSFVHVNNFCDYSPYRYAVPHTRVRNFYRNTTVINNYIVGNNNTIINRGIGRETVARSSQTRVREVTLRDRPVQDVSRVRGDTIERQGNRLVAYRPQLPKDPPRIRSAQFATRAGSSTSGAAVARPGTGGREGSAEQVNRTERRIAQPTTGGRVPSSVNASGRRQREAVQAPRTGVERPEATPDRATPAPRQGRRSSAQAAPSAERPVATPTPGSSTDAGRQLQQSGNAATQAEYQRQQQLRRGPLFGSSVAGGTPAPEATPQQPRRQSAAGRAEARPDSTGTATPQAVQPRPRAQANSPASEASTPRAQRPAAQVQPRASQAAPQRQTPAYQPNNPAAARPATPVYPQKAPGSAPRVMSPRHAEQVSPSYNLPARQAQPAQPSARDYSSPSPRQYSAPAQRQVSPAPRQAAPAPRQAAPSGGGGRGGGGREAAPSRGERAR